jgi:integrase
MIETNSLSSHSLRRSTATLLNESGVPQSVAMALTGHDSADIHSIYVNVGEQAMRDAAIKLPTL